jgi:hypothetical protein
MCHDHHVPVRRNVRAHHQEDRIRGTPNTENQHADSKGPAEYILGVVRGTAEELDQTFDCQHEPWNSVVNYNKLAMVGGSPYQIRAQHQVTENKQQS